MVGALPAPSRLCKTEPVLPRPRGGWGQGCHPQDGLGLSRAVPLSSNLAQGWEQSVKGIGQFCENKIQEGGPDKNKKINPTSSHVRFSPSPASLAVILCFIVK